MKFRSKAEAIAYCIERIKPSIIGLDNYNRFRQLKKRLEESPESVKENAIKNLFSLFGIQEECTYRLNASKAAYKTKELRTGKTISYTKQIIDADEASQSDLSGMKPIDLSLEDSPLGDEYQERKTPEGFIPATPINIMRDPEPIGQPSEPVKSKPWSMDEEE